MIAKPRTVVVEVPPIAWHALDAYAARVRITREELVAEALRSADWFRASLTQNMSVEILDIAGGRG